MDTSQNNKKAPLVYTYLKPDTSKIYPPKTYYTGLAVFFENKEVGYALPIIGLEVEKKGINPPTPVD